MCTVAVSIADGTEAERKDSIPVSVVHRMEGGTAFIYTNIAAVYFQSFCWKPAHSVAAINNITNSRSRRGKSLFRLILLSHSVLLKKLGTGIEAETMEEGYLLAHVTSPMLR